ncbi:phage tail tube protein [Vreelandella sp. H-I2]
MSDPLLWRLLTVAAIIEDEYGVTPEDLTDAVFFDVMTKESPGVYQGDTVERERMKPGFGANEQINVAPYSTRTIRVPYAGSGTPGVPPSYWPLMLCAGHSEEIDVTEGEEKVIYEPVSRDFTSVSLLWWSDDDELQVLPGVRGTVTRTTDAKGMPYFDFSLTGLYQRPTTQAPPTGAAKAPQAGEVPVNKQNSTFMLFGYPAPMQSWSFDMAGQVEHRNLVNYEGVHLTARQAMGQVNIQKPRLADFNIFEKVESHNGTVVDAVTFTHNKIAGNIVDFEATRVQLSNYAETEVQGITHCTMDTRLLSAPEGDGDYRYVFR